jgi:hypothetical protein
MPNLPLPHQPDTNVFRDEVWSGGPTFAERAANHPGVPTTDSGLSGSYTGFDQIPAGWMKCTECDSPEGLGGTPALHRGAWHVRHNGEAFRFVGALPSAAANVSTVHAYTPHAYTPPATQVTFPASPPGEIMYHDPNCQNWTPISEPAGGTNQIGSSTLVSGPQTIHGLIWSSYLWSGHSSSGVVGGWRQTRTTRYLEVTATASQHAQKRYWYDCTTTTTAKASSGASQKSLGAPQGIGSALLQGDTTIVAAANGLLAYYDTNTPSKANVPAVAAFQQAYNASGMPGALTVDGQYGPDTQKALQNTIDANEAGLGPTQPAPANAWGAALPAVPAPDVAPATPAGPGTLVLPETTIVGTPTPNYTPWIIGGVAAAGASLVGYTYWKKHRRGHR